MNNYGQWAMKHWVTWLPTRYATIEDPQTFFSNLGEQVANQIADLADQLAGPDPSDEDYMGKVGRLNMARLQAQEVVLSQEVYLPPEPGTEEIDPDEEEWNRVERETLAMVIEGMKADEDE